jgi:aryl-alcohol dehydrogenase-like predicted oxidoreductase
MMATRKIGTLDVSLAGLGCNNFGMRIDEDVSRAVVATALEVGVNHFDTADVYGGSKSEEFLGRALGPRRDDAVITTKFGGTAPEGVNRGSAEWVAKACDASLERLGTDRIDLYLLHSPDRETPISETLEALGKLVAAGKVREIGCSNFTSAMLDEADATAKELGVPSFVNVQNEYSLVNRTVEAEVLPACDRLGISLVPYFPLASGVLTGKYKQGEPPPEGTRLAAFGDRARSMMSDERMATAEKLATYAHAHGHTLHELALSWLATCPEVASVIAGATSPEQVRSNAAATTAWVLTPAERAEVDAIAPVGASVTARGV